MVTLTRDRFESVPIIVEHSYLCDPGLGLFGTSLV